MNTRGHLSLPPPGHRTGEGSESLLPYLLQLVAAKPGGGASPVDQCRTRLETKAPAPSAEPLGATAARHSPISSGSIAPLPPNVP